MTELNTDGLRIRPATADDVPGFLVWATLPHVRDVWFKDGYAPPTTILEWVAGNGYDFPMIMELDGQAIGFMLYCDLAAYALACPDGISPLRDEAPGTFCIDLFIAEPGLLGRGIGTAALSILIAWMQSNVGAKRLVIDPALSNKRAIRCYEKLGFIPVREEDDGVTTVLIMELQLTSSSEET